MVKYYKNNIDEKFCPKCKIILNRDKFSKSESRYDGCVSYCKQCSRQISIERGIVRPFKCISNSNGLKWCSKCNTIKEYVDFGKNKSSKDGYQKQCKECRRLTQIKYRNESTGKEISKKYRQSDKGKITSQKALRKYRKTERYRKTKIARSISNHIRYSLKNDKQGNSWKDIVKWNMDDFKKHFELLFKNGMSWNNHGLWHIDHIKPIKAFNITDYICDDFKECWSLNNLQPLWSYDNQSKGAKYKGIDYRYE